MRMALAQNGCWIIIDPIGKPPKIKNGVYLFDDMCGMMVQACRPHEAVGEDGAVFGTGTCFQIYANKGDKIKIRAIEPLQKEFTKTQITKARRETTVTVVNQERYDSGPFNFGESYKNGSLAKVIASLEKIRDSIPKEYRANARCAIDSESGYEGSHYASIEVSYVRPETDDEVVIRLQDESIEAMLTERQEKAQLANLKTKYCTQ